MPVPNYFNRIRERASTQWDLLEREPELAGPWHQLFRQVQSPRHVLSELLQNADDAGATEASADLTDDTFVFFHNGEDFEEAHFASLCRFGYSNKRALHTIGFRGIGFKSTFSLGDEVQLITPSLSTAFRRKRFTEPIWQDGTQPKSGTFVRVAVKDPHRKRELLKNLEQWFESPFSLLFFRNIRQLSINSRVLKWVSDGKGPTKNSVWMKLADNDSTRYLLVRSKAERFPEDALEEIREERGVIHDEESHFPPCSVDLVLGAEGRLYVVLPTGVNADLPFACNAPFVQDPARVKIKDPETSPTNRWLLERVGELAAETVLGWVQNIDIPATKRGAAYSLLPNVGAEEDSVESTCGNIVELAAKSRLKSSRFILDDTEQLRGWADCVSVSPSLLAAWSPKQIAQIFLGDDACVLSRNLNDESREKLKRWECINELDSDAVVAALSTGPVPKPRTWKQLLEVWSYIYDELSLDQQKILHILPVAGSDELHCAGEVVRLGDKHAMGTEKDWEFLSAYFQPLDSGWLAYLNEERNHLEKGAGRDRVRLESAFRLLEIMGVGRVVSVNDVLAAVSGKFFEQSHELREYVRLAHIAALLDARVPSDFKFITEDGQLRSLEEGLLVDVDGSISASVDEDWYEQHVLSGAYSRKSASCSVAQWKDWVRSGKSGLLTFLPLTRKQEVFGKFFLRDELKRRGITEDFRSVSSRITFVDYDFDDDIWTLWHSLFMGEPNIFGHLMERILSQPVAYWANCLCAELFYGDIRKKGYSVRDRCDLSNPVAAEWIMKFRKLRCLQDTNGFWRTPVELLRRTPDTEALLGVEPFIRSELDTHALRPLLTVLGVRDKATGPDGLLERLRALSGVAQAPIGEVEKWYTRLDGIANSCSTEDLRKIIKSFREEDLILTNEKEWVAANEIFIEPNDAEIPGVAIIHANVRHLSLWRKVGVADRPTVDLVLDWLKGLESGEKLSDEDVRRVRESLGRFPSAIWEACEHWLSLEGVWSPVRDLKYAITMQTLVPWKHLFPSVKQATADFQKLSDATCSALPFSGLPRLSSLIEEQISNPPGCATSEDTRSWLVDVGRGFQRVELDDEVMRDTLHALGARLARTKMRIVSGLETTPYIDGVPAGRPRPAEVLWKDDILYVQDRSRARMARSIADELGRAFGRQYLIDAINMCYERDSEFITEYLEQNFTLAESSEPAITTYNTQEDDASDKTSADASPLDVDSTRVGENAPPVDNEILRVASIGAMVGEESNPIDRPKEHDPSTPSEKPNSQNSRKPREPKTDLIDLFAAAKGFTRTEVGRYMNSNGEVIRRTRELAFPWEHQSADGLVIRYYWLKSICLDFEPLELEADLWSLCDTFPDLYTLILVDANEKPLEISGRSLREMLDSDRIGLYPSRYRIARRDK